MKNVRQIVGENCVLTAKTPRVLDGSLHIWIQCSLIIAIQKMEKRIYDRLIRCRMPKQRVKVVPRDVCEHTFPKFNWLP